ncbi:hypothetical protein [Jeotgalibacillus marinus]|uniref:Uncharacterized protein n=1 Tax=Jeotgalibacillus marinus TaxID=86667 RepID=A0ABV3Q3E3_9BACL
MRATGIPTIEDRIVQQAVVNVLEPKFEEFIFRKRLRVAMIHHHPTQRKGWAMITKRTIEFFAKIGLVPAYQYYYGKQYGHSLEEYVQHLKEKSIKKRERLIQRKKERREEYYTPQRIRQIYYAKQRLAKN